MLQDLTDLDFDTYFDVANTNQNIEQQPQISREVLYHDDTTNSMNQLLNNARQQLYNYPQQDTFDLFNWSLNQQDTPLHQMSPMSSPQSPFSSDTSHSSPQLNSHSPNTLYSPPTFIKQDDTDSSIHLLRKSMFSSVHPLHHIPGINIPSTPINENGPINPLNMNNNLPSPPLEDNMLTGTFFALDDWNKPKDKNADHETRRWRKSTTRHQQLEPQSIPNTAYFEPGKQLKKVAHNAIERRYRNNINDRIHELKNVVPALYKAKKDTDDDDSHDSQDEGEEIVDGVEVATKFNKATILRKATEYIQFLKNTNESTENENLILQQIIAQMPGGSEILSNFLQQKSEFKKQEEERLAIERREQHEREKIERQRILRERAAQRAALAQLLPKPERRPYRRRQSSKAKSSPKDSAPKDQNNTKVFMAAFMSVVFFTASPSSTKPNDHIYEEVQQSRTLIASTSSFHFWHSLRYMLYAFGLFYFILLPLIIRWLRPRHILGAKKQKGCLEHHHYAKEVPNVWRSRYINLVSIIRQSSDLSDEKSLVSTHIFTTLLDLFHFTVSLCIPKFLLKVFHYDAKPVGCPEELAHVGAWIGLNEIECLGANPNITPLGMLHSSMGMLSQLHKMKRDANHLLYFEPHTMARVYATVALQFSMCLPSWLSSSVSNYFWNKVNLHLKQELKKKKKDVHTVSIVQTKGHQQILKMLQARNGFSEDTEGCRNVFYSFVLPYIASPLDLVLYWQQLATLERQWHAYLHGNRPVFSEKQSILFESVSATTTQAPAHMVQWWVRVGVALESLGEKQTEALAEYTLPSSAHPSSTLLKCHQTMIYHLLKAASCLKNQSQLDQVPNYLKKACKDRKSSYDCIAQMASIDSKTQQDNLEASVLVLSSLAVHVRALKALIEHPSLGPNQASIYMAELRDQVLEDLASPYTASLTVKSKKHIQSLIHQADDTLCL